MYRQSVSVPLSEYVKMIITLLPVIILGYHHPRLVLSVEIQQLMRRVLALMPDPRTNKKCLSELKAENIWVDLETKQPFLHAVSWTRYDANLAKMNYAIVGEIFRDTIFNGELAFLPPDFQELLKLMEDTGHLASYAIQHHCSLVWAVDKKELFGRVYDFSHNILQKWPCMCYEEVMYNLTYPTCWHMIIQGNPYLYMLYSGSWYHPWGPKELLRFMRNAYIHSSEHAVDLITMDQMYNQADLGEMIETALPRVLHNFQVQLDKLGLLRFTMLESLFH